MRPLLLSLFLTILLSLLLAPTLALAGRVLYVGDSHSYLKTLTPQPVGRRLGNELIDGERNRGNSVDYFAACGASPGSWASGGTTPCGYTAYLRGEFRSEPSSRYPAASSLNAPSYDQVIVNLGDNMFKWTREEKLVSSFDVDRFHREMDSFFRAIGNVPPAKCAWVGPTYHVEGSNYHKTNAAVDQLYAALGAYLRGKCKLVDSRRIVVTNAPNDGLHHLSADSATWGKGILRALGL